MSPKKSYILMSFKFNLNLFYSKQIHFNREGGVRAASEASSEDGMISVIFFLIKFNSSLNSSLNLNFKLHKTSLNLVFKTNSRGLEPGVMVITCFFHVCTCI